MRVATVLIVGVAGLMLGSVAIGLSLGVIAGVGCVVMGESSMDAGAYKYPEKPGGF